jgi:hypothetical protein
MRSSEKAARGGVFDFSSDMVRSIKSNCGIMWKMHASWGLECSSVAQRLPSMYEAPVSIPSTAKHEANQNQTLIYLRNTLGQCVARSAKCQQSPMPGTAHTDYVSTFMNTLARACILSLLYCREVGKCLALRHLMRHRAVALQDEELLIPRDL